MRRVVLSPPAEKDPLAQELQRRVVANLTKPPVLRSFSRMWATVVIVCRPAVNPDGAPASGDAARLTLDGRGTTLTLRFDYGSLTIHEGRVGRPDITVWGTVDEILSIGLFRTFLPGVGAQMFGKAAHLRLAFRLARVLDGGPELR